GHGNDADGVDEDNPATARQEASDDLTREHEDRGHGNDVDGLDGDNPAYIKGTSGASWGDEEDLMALSENKSVFSGDDTANGTSWLSATDDDQQGMTSSASQSGDWMSHVEDDQGNQQQSYQNLTEEENNQQEGYGSLPDFSSLDSLEG
ncbi:MAG: hypothetical protein HQL55_13705, partial [Magnetococcales bacterium]|nr:hypothetical protein [Magnetococcales bacterium]